MSFFQICELGPTKGIFEQVNFCQLIQKIPDSIESNFFMVGHAVIERKKKYPYG